MKIYYLFVGLLLFNAGLMQAQSGKTTIRGKVHNAKTSDVSVTILRNPAGYDEETIRTPIGKDGSFNISFTLSHGLETVSLNNATLYIAPGDELTVNFDATKPIETMQFSGTKANENNFMARYAAITGYELMVSHNQRIEANDQPSEYFVFVDSIAKSHIKEFISFKSKYPVSSSFEQLINWDITYATLFRKQNYYFIKKYSKPTQTILQDWSFMDSVKIQVPEALKIMTYRAFIDNFVSYHLMTVTNYIKPDYDEFNLHQTRYRIADQFFQGQIKEYLLANTVVTALGSGNSTQATLLYDDFIKRFPESSFLLGLKELHEKTLSLAPGSPAPDFTLNDLNGKKVSLSNFRGKVVYLDIWASWCKPCIAEIPAAKKLKEQFEGKDVVFLNVSIDTNESSWRKVISEKNIEGIHLISSDGGIGWESLIARLYNIYAVPTYYLIGKNGNIIDNRPPRPSQSDKIEQALHKALAN